MKAILFLIVAGAAGYWAWNQYVERGPKNPVYAEFRVKYSNGVELVGIGKMDSSSDCERRAEEVWRRTLATDANAQISPIRCDIQLPTRFEGLFSNKTTHATYLAMDRGDSSERDGRFIIYGVPSSEVVKVCPAIIEQIKRNYRGKIECIPGSVG